MRQALLKQEYNDTNHYLEIIHGESKGYISRVEIKSIFKQWHYTLENLLKQEFKMENVYISLNTFYSTFRRVEYLKELNAHFIDLDTYKTKFTKGVASGKCGFHTLRAFSPLIPMVCRLFRYSKVYIVL